MKNAIVGGMLVVLLGACNLNPNLGHGGPDGGLDTSAVSGNPNGGAPGSSSSNVCDHLDRTLASSNEKARPCGLRVQLPNKTQCQAAIGHCTAADQSSIETLLTCIDRVSVCSAGHDRAFADAVNSCVAALRISQTCDQAFH